MPTEENDIAPIAQAESGRKYASGIDLHSVRVWSGSVPLGQTIHVVSDSGERICAKSRDKTLTYFYIFCSGVKPKHGIEFRN